MIRSPRQKRSAIRSAPAFVVESVADALLPWGDPYIIKLAQALEREAREQVEAAFRAAEEEDALRATHGDTDDEILGPISRRREWSLDLVARSEHSVGN